MKEKMEERLRIMSVWSYERAITLSTKVLEDERASRIRDSAEVGCNMERNMQGSEQEAVGRY